MSPRTPSKASNLTTAERTWHRFWSALDDPTGRRKVYVYRISPDGHRVTPNIWNGYAWDHLPEHLRDHFGGGDFHILIREGRRLIFSGDISIVTLPQENASGVQAMHTQTPIQTLNGFVLGKDARN